RSSARTSISASIRDLPAVQTAKLSALRSLRCERCPSPLGSAALVPLHWLLTIFPLPPGGVPREEVSPISQRDFLMTRRQILGVRLLLASLLVGCGGGGPALYDVSGAVTLDGKPVPFGRITFTPDLSKGNSGGPGYAGIVDGKFTTASATGRGVIG